MRDLRGTWAHRLANWTSRTFMQYPYERCVECLMPRSCHKAATHKYREHWMAWYKVRLNCFCWCCVFEVLHIRWLWVLIGRP